MSGTTYHGPINPNPADGEAGIIIYGYVPSYGLAITGVVTFALILAANLFHTVRKAGYRSFHILLNVGAVRHATCRQDTRTVLQRGLTLYS